MSFEEFRKKMKRMKNFYYWYNIAVNKYGFTKFVTTKEFDDFFAWVNKTIKGAPKLLQNSYENLYVLAKTQKAYANERNVTEKYIQILHKRMLVYLFNSLNKEQE